MTSASASCSTSSTTTSALGARRSRAFGPYFTDRYETFWGDALDYSQRGVARVGDPERRALGARLRRRRPAPGRGARGLRRLAARTCSPSSPSVSARSRRGRCHRRDGDGRPAPARGLGPRRAVGRRAPPPSARAADRRARRLLRRVRLARGPRGGAAPHTGRAPDRLLAEPRPGRQPRARRPAGARRARAACGSARSSRRRRRCSSRARSTASSGPSATSPTTSIPRSPRRRGQGRKREFAFAGEVPDPQAEETFLVSKLDRSRADEELRAFYRELLALRRELPREIDVSVDGSLPARASRLGRARRGLRSRGAWS